jgi:hypothetical protein
MPALACDFGFTMDSTCSGLGFTVLTTISFYWPQNLASLFDDSFTIESIYSSNHLKHCQTNHLNKLTTHTPCQNHDQQQQQQL